MPTWPHHGRTRAQCHYQTKSHSALGGQQANSPYSPHFIDGDWSHHRTNPDCPIPSLMPSPWAAKARRWCQTGLHVTPRPDRSPWTHLTQLIQLLSLPAVPPCCVCSQLSQSPCTRLSKPSTLSLLLVSLLIQLGQGWTRAVGDQHAACQLCLTKASCQCITTPLALWEVLPPLQPGITLVFATATSHGWLTGSESLQYTHLFILSVLTTDTPQPADGRDEEPQGHDFAFYIFTFVSHFYSPGP